MLAESGRPGRRQKPTLFWCPPMGKRCPSLRTRMTVSDKTILGLDEALFYFETIADHLPPTPERLRLWTHNRIP